MFSTRGFALQTAHEAAVPPHYYASRPSPRRVNCESLRRWVRKLASTVHFLSVYLPMYFYCERNPHRWAPLWAFLFMCVTAAARPVIGLVFALRLMRWLGLRLPRPEPGMLRTSRKWLAAQKPFVLGERHLLVEQAPSIKCPICLDDLRLGSHALRLPCRHYFHPACLMPWIEKHNSCPTCRHGLPSAHWADVLESMVDEVAEDMPSRTPQAATPSAAPGQRNDSAMPSVAPRQRNDSATPSAAPGQHNDASETLQRHWAAVGR